MTIDIAQKLSQIGFYTVAIVLTILTYLNARKGLLNPINIEYHKHVIERLKEISAELLSEYDEFSDNYWARNKATIDALDRIREDFRDNRTNIKTARP